MSVLSIAVFNQMNPTYFVSPPKQKLTNQRPKGKSDIDLVDGTTAAVSMSAGFAGPQHTHHNLPVMCIKGNRLWRNGFVKCQAKWL